MEGLHRHALMAKIALAFLHHSASSRPKGAKETPNRHRNPICQSSDSQGFQKRNGQVSILFS